MMFDHFQTHPVLGGVFDRLLPRVTLIDKSQLDILARGHLCMASRPARPTCARSCSLAGVTFTASKCPSVSTAVKVEFGAFTFLMSVKSPPARQLSGVDWKRATVQNHRAGRISSPGDHARSTRRKSPAMVSKQPARSQR